jgi:hypothetical protein
VFDVPPPTKDPKDDVNTTSSLSIVSIIWN